MSHEEFANKIYDEISKIKNTIHTENTIDKILDELAEMLIEKNKKYGNSALEPVRKFSKATVKEGLLVRMDDKVSRLEKGIGDDEDTMFDLMGYGIIYRIAPDE